MTLRIPQMSLEILDDLYVIANTAGIDTRYEKSGYLNYLYFLRKNTFILSFAIDFDSGHFDVQSLPATYPATTKTRMFRVHYGNTEEWQDFWEWFRESLKGNALARTTRK